jgi:hypothetical protein
VGGDEGGDSWPDPEELPDVEDPVGEVLAAGDVVFEVVVAWPGSALLRYSPNTPVAARMPIPTDFVTLVTRPNESSRRIRALRA